MRSVPAINFCKKVKFTSRLEKIRNLRQSGDRICNLVGHISLDLNTNQTSLVPAQFLWFDDGDNLHYAAVQKLLDAPSNGTFGYIQIISNLGKWRPPIVLQLGDDRLIDVI